MTYIYVNTIPGLKNVSLNIDNPDSVTISDLISLIYNKLPPSISKSTYVSLQNGTLLSRENYNKTISQLFKDDPDYLLLRLNSCLCGGKGGFGSMLRSQGKKKRKKGNPREEDTDHFRTLDGRTMKSIRQAKELLGHLEKLPKLERERIEKKRAKLQAIIDAANRTGSSSKFDDTEYLETSENLILDVRNAVINSGVKIDEGRDSESESESDSDSDSDSEAKSDTGSSTKSSTSLTDTENVLGIRNKGKITAGSKSKDAPPIKAANFFGDEEYDDDEE